jgi:hypothetical protein
MKNHLIRLIILLFIVTQGLVAEDNTGTVDEDASAAEEEKETYIKEFVEDYEETLGFFVTYRDPESNKIFLKITKDQLKSEFIYFAHVLNGVASTGKVKGSYTDEGVFKIEKDFNKLRFSRVLTNYSFDKDSPLAKSQGANISDSTFQVFEILANNEDEDEYLINITGCSYLKH